MKRTHIALFVVAAAVSGFSLPAAADRVYYAKYGDGYGYHHTRSKYVRSDREHHRTWRSDDYRRHRPHPEARPHITLQWGYPYNYHYKRHHRKGHDSHHRHGQRPRAYHRGYQHGYEDGYRAAQRKYHRRSRRH